MWRNKEIFETKKKEKNKIIWAISKIFIVYLQSYCILVFNLPISEKWIVVLFILKIKLTILIFSTY